MNSFNLSRELRRAVLLVLLWGLVAAAVNTVSPNRIAWVGPWPSTYGTDSTAVPPSYIETDPPILRLDGAIAMYQSKEVTFVDARDPADFEYSHIPGALNLPFDYYDDYAGDVLPLLDRQRDVVTYCGGEDCELSLFLARQLINEGFEKVHIFFGGHDAWQAAELPLAEGE